MPTLNASGIAFEAYPSLAGTGASWMEIPFSEFKVAPWDTSNLGKTLGADLLKEVRNFGMYVNKNEGKAEPGTLYIDSIQVIP